MDTSQREKMMAGELYFAFGADLSKGRATARALMRQYNSISGDTPEDTSKGLEILKRVLGGFDAEEPPFIEAPFYCDYGSNIFLGKDVYINFNCTFLDCNTIRIGNRCLFGPNVQLYPPGHPLDAHVRQGTKGPEFAKPITVGDDCWFGGGAIVLGGVTIGDGGAVVTKNVDSYVVVAGNPARVIKRLEKPLEKKDNEAAAAV